MRLEFREDAAPYESGSQKARFWSEDWAARELYCPRCGASPLQKLPNNSPVGDFSCSKCSEEFELKSQAGKIGAKVLDGAYRTMMERLNASNNPSLVLMAYDKKWQTVSNLAVVPKHFFVPEIIEERKPLAPAARRAGWVGCNILLDRVPAAGKIFIVRNGALVPKDAVLERWNQTAFLRDMRSESKGWLLEVLRCVEELGRSEFELANVYAFEKRLQTLYPANQHVREKMRQQLQVLRDRGFVEFLGKGRYRLVTR